MPSIRAPFPAGTTTIAASTSPVTQSVTVNSGDTALRATVWVSAGTDTGMTVSCTANGVAADGSSNTRHSNGQTAGFIKTFYWLNPTTGTYNVVATVSGGTPDGVGLKCHALTGSSGAPTYSYDSNPQNTTNVTSCSCTTGTVASGDLAIGSFGSGSAFSSVNNTQQALDTAPGGSSACTSSAMNSAAGAGSTITLTGNHASDWSCGIAEVWAAAAAAPAAQPYMRFNPGAALKRKMQVRLTNPMQGGSKVTPGATWFTDAELGGSGSPLLLVSAEDWGVLPNAALNHSGDTTATWDDYFSHRQAQGYNCVQTCIFGYGSVAGFGLDSPVTPEGGDVDSVYPFNTNSNDPNNANNSTWWTRRDNFFAKARAYGFRVMLNITTPNINAGTFLNSWTLGQWQAWGTKIGTYLANPNLSHVMIIVADDYFGTKDTEMNAMLANIRAAGATQPIAIQWYQETSSRKDIYNGTDLTTANNFARDAQYNFGYSYNVWYDVVEKMGNEVNQVPYFAADGTFLNTGGITGITDKQLLRRQVWWALSSGSKGFQVGDNNVWQWASTALAEVTSNTFYTAVVPAIAAYFRSLPNWHKLKADTSSQLVTAGRGTHATPLVSGGSGGQYLSDSDSYVTASLTVDGTLAVIYMSHGSTITIDESKMVGGYTATWVDPKTCATSAATPGTTYNSTAKGNNSDGQADWVLVLQAPGSAVNATATPSVVSAATSVPSPVVQTGETVTASVVNATTTVPTPTITSAATVAATVVLALASVAAPTVSVGVTISPSVVAAVASVPAPTVATGETVTPAVVSATTTIPTPSVSTSGNATATPSVVALTTSIPTPTISSQATAAPSVVAVTTSVPTPTVGAGVTLFPSVVAAVTSVGTATVATGETVAPSVVTVTTSIPAPSVSAGGNATASPSVVAVITTVPAPAVSTGSRASASVVPAVTTIATPAITSSTTITPATVTALATVGNPVLHLSTTVTPTTVAVIATVPSPAAVTGAHHPADPLRSRAVNAEDRHPVVKAENRWPTIPAENRLT